MFLFLSYNSQLHSEHEKKFNYKAFSCLMIALIVTILIDTSVVKIYDVTDKNFIPFQYKLLLFSINSVACLVLQFFVIKYVQSSVKVDRQQRRLVSKPFFIISIISLCILGALIGTVIFQQYYYKYYITSITISIITISYGTATVFIIRLSLLFLSWYRSNRSLIVFLYFLSMSLIAFNLIMTAAYTGAKVNDRPDRTGVFVGGGGDNSGGRYPTLDMIHRISSFMSFFSIWTTTAILMNYYRERLINAVIYWIILSIPLIYYFVTYFYQYILGKALMSYIALDPVTASIVLSAFLSLSKPIGGVIFGFAFWNIAKIVGYERNIKTYMIISGWGIFLIFATNQAASQMLTPYPPFGLATISVLNLASFLMLLGIYNSATLVSANTNLRKSIHKHALESKLLNLIGHAEFEREIQKTVYKISRDTADMEIDSERRFDLDENELKRYLDIVIKEVKKGERTPDR